MDFKSDFSIIAQPDKIPTLREKAGLFGSFEKGHTHQGGGRKQGQDVLFTDSDPRRNGWRRFL